MKFWALPFSRYLTLYGLYLTLSHAILRVQVPWDFRNVGGSPISRTELTPQALSHTPSSISRTYLTLQAPSHAPISRFGLLMAPRSTITARTLGIGAVHTSLVAGIRVSNGNNNMLLSRLQGSGDLKWLAGCVHDWSWHRRIVQSRDVFRPPGTKVGQGLSRPEEFNNRNDPTSLRSPMLLIGVSYAR